MDSMDKRLKNELAEGPLSRHGFDDRLRRRIEERLDEKPNPRRRLSLRIGGFGAGVLAMAAMLLLVVRLQDPGMESAQTTANHAVPVVSSDALAVAEGEVDAADQSAVLVGLRRDNPESPDPYDSTYRTLLLTTDGRATTLEAEGDGILMPYRIDFWQLEMAETERNGLFRTIGAYNTSFADKLVQPIADIGYDQQDYGVVKEKLLFAGNRYVALARHQNGEDTVRVMDILQLGKPRDAGWIVSGIEPYVKAAVGPDRIVEAVASDAEAGANEQVVDEWAVAREPGYWVGRIETAPGTAESFRLDEAISNDIEPLVDWKTIRSVVPAATDVFSSPARNSAMIVSDRSLAFYAVEGQKLGSQTLELTMETGESVVMVQWALDSYVEAWQEKAGALLNRK